MKKNRNQSSNLINRILGSVVPSRSPYRIFFRFLDSPSLTPAHFMLLFMHFVARATLSCPFSSSPNKQKKNCYSAVNMETKSEIWQKRRKQNFGHDRDHEFLYTFLSNKKFIRLPSIWAMTFTCDYMLYRIEAYKSTSTTITNNEQPKLNKSTLGNINNHSAKSLFLKYVCMSVLLCPFGIERVREKKRLGSLWAISLTYNAKWNPMEQHINNNQPKKKAE